MKRSKALNIVLVAMLVSGLAAVIIFGIPGIIVFGDDKVDRLVNDTVPRLVVGLILAAVINNSEYCGALAPRGGKNFGRALIWCLPCFAVAAVNFPYTALIGGAAVIERVDLLWLFLLKCFSIAFMEEMFFRALVLPFLLKKIKGRLDVLWAMLISAAIFALVHLLNLFYGANVAATMLQVGYTFLLGCMFAVMLVKTKNVWLCVAVHFIFDIGGTIVTDLGSGSFQDTTFWVLTAVVGALATVCLTISLVKIIKTRQKQSE